MPDLISERRTKGNNGAYHLGLALSPECLTTSEFHVGKRVKKQGIALTVDKNVPIPCKSSILEGGITETLRSMEIGDSFVIGRERRNQVLTTADRLGVAVTTRCISAEEARVWKIGTAQHQEKLAERRKQSQEQPIPYKQPPPPRPERAKPSTGTLEPERAVSLCAAAGIKAGRFNPSLIEWKIRGVTEADLQQAIAAGASSLEDLDRVFKGAH